MRRACLAVVLLLALPNAAADPQPEPPGLGDPPCGHEGPTVVEQALDRALQLKCLAGDLAEAFVHAVLDMAYHLVDTCRAQVDPCPV